MKKKTKKKQHLILKTGNFIMPKTLIKVRVNQKNDKPDSIK